MQHRPVMQAEEGEAAAGRSRVRASTEVSVNRTADSTRPVMSAGRQRYDAGSASASESESRQLPSQEHTLEACSTGQ